MSDPLHDEQKEKLKEMARDMVSEVAHIIPELEDLCMKEIEEWE